MPISPFSWRRCPRGLLCVAVAAWLSGPAAAQLLAAQAEPAPVPVPAPAAAVVEFPPVYAVRLGAGEQIRLKGRLDHPAWQRAPAFDGFVEKDPQFGAPPAQRTRVQVLFDDRAIYVTSQN